jgi:CRISPR-associated protein Csm4
VKLHEIVLKPLSAFGTPMKGDTFFGHFCWQALHQPDILKGGFDDHIAAYRDRPFVVFSSACLKISNGERGYFLKRPEMPFACFTSADEDRKTRIIAAKDQKNKKWMFVGEELRIDPSRIQFITDNELSRRLGVEAEEVALIFSQPHNSINRMTGKTGEGSMFAPYEKENIYYPPGCELSVFVLVDENATDIEKVTSAVENIGKWGFGRDASSGKGRFKVSSVHSLSFPDTVDANACYSLAPALPRAGDFEKMYFRPFVRFGKHGDRLAVSKNPFKNPVILADEGGAFFPADRTKFEKPYIGSAITGLSKVQPQTVFQGYAPYLPMKLEQ